MSALPGALAPSLSLSHNCAADVTSDTPAATPDLPFQLTGSQKKTAYALRQNIERMIAEAGLESIGFTTFTLGDRDESGAWVKVYDAAEASKRWHKLCRRVVRDVFEKLVVVTERHADGGIHFHCIGVITGRPDIRTGCDVEACERGDYTTAPESLKAVWKLLREGCPKLGFGRAETYPIKKNGPAVAAYVSKYVEKNLFNRLKADCGKKLVRYVGWDGSQMKPNEFCWVTPAACAWRIRAEVIASTVGAKSREDAAAAFGPRWAWRITNVMNEAERALGLSFADWVFWVGEIARREMVYPEWEIYGEDERRWQEFREGELRTTAQVEAHWNGFRPEILEEAA